MSEQKQPVLIEPEAPTGFYPLDWLLNQFKSFALTLWDIFTDFFLFLIDAVMSAGMLLLNGFSSFFELIDISKYISSMPTEILFVIDATGLGTAIGMVMTAGTIRLFLQLIPFVRLGS
jgi:hypothetical protein